MITLLVCCSGESGREMPVETGVLSVCTCTSEVTEIGGLPTNPHALNVPGVSARITFVLQC